MMNMYVAKLSHENFSLAYSELNSILLSEDIPYTVELKLDEFVVFESSTAAVDVLLKRAALLLELGEFITILETQEDIKEISKIIKDVDNGKNVCLIVDSVKSFGKSIASKIVREVPSWMLCTRKKVDLGSEIIKISFIANVALIYRMIYRRRQRAFIDREPHHRPCYRPGTMKPLFARIFVNLSRVSSLRGEVVLDPFCGVGGFAIEACLMGLRVICSDIDEDMVKDARTNIDRYSCSNLVEILRMDAGFEAISSMKVDSIATDPPYGIQSIARGYKTLEELMTKFIEGSYSVLKKDKFMVFATPLTISKHVDVVLVSRGFEVIEKHIDKVHGSLARVIYVVKKT